MLKVKQIIVYPFKIIVIIVFPNNISGMLKLKSQTFRLPMNVITRTKPTLTSDLEIRPKRKFYIPYGPLTERIFQVYIQVKTTFPESLAFVHKI